MTYVHTLILIAGISIGVSGSSSFAADMGSNSSKRAMSSNASERIVRPHYRPTGESVSVTWGEKVFNDHCALCHGLHGKGDGPRSAYFQPGVQFIPDLTIAGYLQGREAVLLESIREGLSRLPEPAYVMPQFKYILSDEEIQSVLAYVMTLSQEAKQ